MVVALCMFNIHICVIYIILTRISLRTQQSIKHMCMLNIHDAATIFVLNSGGQLVHLDMAT